MSWGSCVPILVLLILNVLAAEAFIGNNWNSRDLNFRRPLLVDSKPNQVIQPVHSVPRPLPKPVVVQRDSSALPSVRKVEERVQEEPVREQAAARYYQPLPQRFNLQRRPLAAPQPAPIAPRPIAPPAQVPIAASSEPEAVDSEIIKINRELLVPVSSSTEKVLVSSNPSEASAEDIQVFLSHASPAASSSSPPLRHYIMARPLPQPTTVAPIRSVTIMRDEPEPEDKIELTLPTSSFAETSSTAPISSRPSEIPTVIVTSTPIVPKYIPEEPEIVEVEESVVSEEPVKVTTVEAKPIVVEDYSAMSLGGRSSWRKPLLSTRQPAWQPTQKPVSVSPPARTISRPKPSHAKTFPRVTIKPAPAETSSRLPISSRPSEIPAVTVTSTPIMPKFINPDELEIVEIDTPEPVISEEPVKVITVEEKPTIVEDYSAMSVGGRSSWRKPLPAIREPAWQPTEKPVPVSPPRRIYRPKPSHDGILLPHVTAKPAPVPTPVPLIIPAAQPKQGRSVPIARVAVPEPTQLMDYTCDQENIYHDIPNDCDSFVECKAFVPMMNTCPDGLHFNRLAVWPDYPCAYPSEVQCAANSIRHDPQPTEMCPRQYGLFPMPDSDCGRYLMCQEGVATVMDCPPGLVFNTATNTCDWPANVPNCSPDVFRGFTCPVPPLEEDGTPSDMILKFRFQQSCKEYIACQLGHPRLLSCDPGLSFDEESEVCVDSEYVQNCRT